MSKLMPISNLSLSIKRKIIYMHVIFLTASMQCTKVHFASFLSGELTTTAVINPPEKKLAKRTSVQ